MLLYVTTAIFFDFVMLMLDTFTPLNMFLTSSASGASATAFSTFLIVRRTGADSAITNTCAPSTPSGTLVTAIRLSSLLKRISSSASLVGGVGGADAVPGAPGGWPASAPAGGGAPGAGAAAAAAAGSGGGAWALNGSEAPAEMSKAAMA